ncbi:MAG: hypothetical protein M3Z31_15755 [Pseudomonadota bacterium]|nr:hypothetical protein [Pseudomonadota bacterium]
MDLRHRLPELLPLAIAWAEAEASRGLAEGVPLDAAALALAGRVGVRDPQRIRVIRVHEMPAPGDPLLRQATREAGLSGPNSAGLTLGHAIFLRSDDQRPQLLAHECRHVAQYESFGSIGAFLRSYLADVIRVGYRASLLERDARAFENAFLDPADATFEPTA